MMKANRGKASVLAVGTELTTGQVTNRNAAWISDKLVQLGVEVVLHETVPDDRILIKSALDRCQQMSQLIFVTGGLGPTTDDFTREVIADWLGKKLEFHEPSWQRIQDRLGQFGIPVALSNRQQCYFPNQAQILENPEGTASGFTHSLSDGFQRIWIFPGPPREVSAVWEQGVQQTIHDLLPEIRPLKLFTWQCMGKSEAELGEITEKVLAGSNLSIGYRAHRPFVEVKVWCQESEVSSKTQWIEKLEKALSEWIVTSQGDDLADLLLKKLERSDEIEILDAASGGILGSRLADLLRKSEYHELAQTVTLATEWATPDEPEEWVSTTLAHADPNTLTLTLAGFTADGKGFLGLREGQRVFQTVLQSPYVKIELLERTRLYFVEMALKQWNEWLHTNTV